jgi:tetratricopeptide (TPR) repeat protein
LYFDGERYEEAMRWYEAALKVDPKNVNASTDLGIAYYYSNQPDRALEQFDRSLAIDPRHSKTLLNVGIVRAFGKSDLDGAEKAWQRVLDVAPNSPEAALARKGLDGLRAGHAGQGATAPAAKNPAAPE